MTSASGNIAPNFLRNFDSTIESGHNVKVHIVSVFALPFGNRTAVKKNNLLYLYTKPFDMVPRHVLLMEFTHLIVLDRFPANLPKRLPR